MFEKIKRFYEMRLYTAEQVYNFFLKSKITEQEYNDITGGKEE